MSITTNRNELIVYTNSRNGLGIRVLGAKRPTNKSGIYIKQLLDDGLAQRDGRLKVGDQILAINDETTIGISREYAVNLLRSAAATNQVRLHVRHFYPNFANEYQKFLFDEKSTDDDDDNEIHRTFNHSHNRHSNHNNSNDYQNRSTTTTNEVRMRRKHHQNDLQQSYRHSAHDLISDKKSNDRNLKGLDVSHDALQSLLHSKFLLVDLVDLLKKIYPNFFSNDQKREYQFIQQLSQTNSDGRINLKDFEQQSSILLGERINLLSPFYSSSTYSSNKNNQQIVAELHHELSLCRSTINELQNQIITCEKSQRLSEQVEVEYEDVLKFVYEQLRQYKQNEINQSKYLRANDQLIEKLFNYLFKHVNKTTDEQILSQLKYEYEQQKKILLENSQHNGQNAFTLSNRKSHQQF